MWIELVMAESPVRLTVDREAIRLLPEIPDEVVDAFGSKVLVVHQRDRWIGLVPHEGGLRPTRLLEGRLQPSATITTRSFGQLLDTNEAGRTLVVGGQGESLFAIEPDASARCLGVMVDDGWTSSGERVRFECAAWLPDGGVAALVGADVCLYAAADEGPLVPRARLATGMSRPDGVRRIPGLDVVIVATEDRLSVLALDADVGARELARIDDLALVGVQFFLDETGNRVSLLEGPWIFLDGDAARIDGLEQALAMRAEFPPLPAAESPAPVLIRGEDRPAPSEPPPKVVARVEPDALLEPDLRRLWPLTRAVIRMLRSAGRRATPDMEMLKLIRPDMPDDLRAWVHAWATHHPLAPAVDEFWMAPPRPVTEPYLRELAGMAVHLGTYASGEPILARRSTGPSCQVVMIDEEGIPYRYHGIEAFLADLRMRCEEDRRAFELDRWMDEAE
jgi:hypothetical protein